MKMKAAGSRRQLVSVSITEPEAIVRGFFQEV